jgi:hypothetical protein
MVDGQLAEKSSENGPGFMLRCLAETATEPGKRAMILVGMPLLQFADKPVSKFFHFLASP